MSEFKKFIGENSNISMSQGYVAVSEKLNSLEKVLSPTSVLSRSIQKTGGKGYAKDFEKMSKQLSELIDMWEELDREVQGF